MNTRIRKLERVGVALQQETRHAIQAVREKTGREAWCTGSVQLMIWKWSGSDTDIAVADEYPRGSKEREMVCSEMERIGGRRGPTPGETRDYYIFPAGVLCSLAVDVQIRPRAEIVAIVRGGKMAAAEYTLEHHARWVDGYNALGMDKEQQYAYKMAQYARYVPSLRWE